MQNESVRGMTCKIQDPPEMILGEKGVSSRLHVGTKNMVRYSLMECIQGKLCWNPIAIMTCKYIVKFGYGGERLIKPSSSWFPPKLHSVQL